MAFSNGPLASSCTPSDPWLTVVSTFAWQNFLIAQEAAHVAKMKPPDRNVRVEPKMGVEANMLFSHGMTHGQKFVASMAALHYTDPATRSCGVGGDRVHKTYFWGTKHIDKMVPQNDPNPRMSLTNSKSTQWYANKPPEVPVAPACYMSESKLHFVDHKVQPTSSPFARKFAL